MDEYGSVENSWAVYQFKIMANFVNGCYFFVWFIGGFNYQVEYYFFLNICYIYYLDIVFIVKVIVEEYGIFYYEYFIFLAVLCSYFWMLYKLGNNQYEW